MENTKCNSVVKIPLTQKSTVYQRMVKQNCGREAKGLFDKLMTWKEESQRQISNILETHGSNIQNGIHDLEEQVSSIQAELLVLRKERTVLLETVEYLHGEIKQLNSKLLPLPEDDKELETPVAENLDAEVCEAKHEIQGTEMRLDTEMRL